MKSVAVTPKLGTRMMVIGQTGSGKTYFIVKLIRNMLGLRQIVVLDTKGEDDYLTLGGAFCTEFKELEQHKFPEVALIVYRPNGAEMADGVTLDKFCEWVYQRGHTICVIDEMTQVQPRTNPTAGFLNLYTRGRSKDCTTIAGTQRPSGVPRIVYTEAQYIIKFLLADVRDRMRVTEFTIPSMLPNPQQTYGFLFYEARKQKVYELGRVK